jgi:hypothetical protein
VRAAAADAFAYAGWLYCAGLAPALAGAALLAYAVLSGRSLYPRWFAALNPALLFLLCASFRLAPAPVGGPLVIGSGNLVFLVFFAASTALLWNGGRYESPRVGPPAPQNFTA